MQRKGFDVLVTGRDYDFTRGLIERSGLPYRIVGRYGGASLYEKLRADIERMNILAEIMSEFKPDVLVSYPLPAAVRVAYGLGVPVVLMSDSPHSRPVHLLTVPLSRYLIHSYLIPTVLFHDYLVPGVSVRVFHGVEEWEWIEGHVCDKTVLDMLGLERDSYIVFRTPEFKAAYYRGSPLDKVARLVEEAVRRGYRVVAFPRYREDASLLERLAEKHKGSVIVLQGEPIETLDLYCYSRGVITGGATMAREAALLCKPAVSLYPVYLNIVLEKLGLPIRTRSIENPGEILNTLEELRVTASKCAVVEEFEKPSSVVLSVLEEMASSAK